MSLFHPFRRPTTRKCRLAVEGLEQRSLMAAGAAVSLDVALASPQARIRPDVVFTGDLVLQEVDLTLTASFGSTSGGAQIVVDGSDYHDWVTIQDMNVSTGDVSLKLEQYSGGGQFSAGTLISSRVERLHAGRALDPAAPVYITTKGGNDHITNLSAGAMTVYAGDGADVISGGPAGEYIDAGAGNDVVYANGGNDTVTARDGDDTVYGGDDTVYGGPGLGKLYGDAGNDGLFGGANDGKDTLTGGPGADRFLMSATKGSGQNANREDSSTDATSEDARPAFVNGYQASFDGKTYTAKNWTDADVLRADAVLELLQREGHGTELLKRNGGGEMGIVRHGTAFRGFNDGWVHMTDAGSQFGDTTDVQLRGYLLHEIGHNWQGGAFQSAGTSYWNQFKGVSDWRTADPHDARYTLSTNEGHGDRWYLTASGFASEYAKTNENEDFAESFSAYFTRQAGWTDYYGEPGAAGAPAKMAVFADWAAGL